MNTKYALVLHVTDFFVDKESGDRPILFGHLPLETELDDQMYFVNSICGQFVTTTDGSTYRLVWTSERKSREFLMQIIQRSFAKSA